MAIWVLGEGLALALLGLGAPVPDPAPPKPMVSSFALARTAPPLVVQESISRSGQYTRLRPVAAEDGWSPPLRTWGDAGSGPVIELGALGASKIRKRRADLVHLSLDWGF